MGGNSAWKKRVANGELAKGSGGAIARHRPRWGRKGKDLILNRKGHIGGGNPKKKKTKKRDDDDDDDVDERYDATTSRRISEMHPSKQKGVLQVSHASWNHNITLVVVVSILIWCLLIFVVYGYNIISKQTLVLHEGKEPSKTH